MEFKTIIVEARKRMKLTQIEFAEKLNVSDKTVSKWETGVNFPDIKMLNAIARVIDVPVLTLLSADELRVEQVNIVEYDDTKIRQYTTIQIINTLLLMLPNLGFLSVYLLFSTYSPFLFWLMPLSTFTSVVVFVSVSYNFHSFYSKKFYREKYDRVFVFYTLLYIDLMLMSIFTFSIYVLPMVGRFQVFLLISLLPISIFIKHLILKKNNFSINLGKIELINCFLFVIFIILYIMLQIFFIFQNYFHDIGINAISIVETLFQLRIIYGIGPILVSFLIFRRRIYEN